jgi:hypothetical protein
MRVGKSPRSAATPLVSFLLDCGQDLRDWIETSMSEAEKSPASEEDGVSSIQAEGSSDEKSDQLSGKRKSLKSRGKFIRNQKKRSINAKKKVRCSS